MTMTNNPNARPGGPRPPKPAGTATGPSPFDARLAQMKERNFPLETLVAAGYVKDMVDTAKSIARTAFGDRMTPDIIVTLARWISDVESELQDNDEEEEGGEGSEEETDDENDEVDPNLRVSESKEAT